MKYGYFDDINQEYVITNPNTPYPWINYLGCEKLFGIISNTAGGYCFYRDASLRRLTRYRYNNVPLDSGGRYFYINENGTVWCPGSRPSQSNLHSYKCRHGLGYTSISGEKNGLQCTQLAFVPIGVNAEVHRITLKNKSEEKKRLSLFSFVEFCQYNALADMTNFQRNLSTGEVEVDGSIIYHKTEYRERRNHYTFWSASCDINGFDTDRDEFVGLYNSYSNPQVVHADRSRNSIASGWSPAGSHRIEIELSPGQERSIVFMLGYVENRDDDKFLGPGRINTAPAVEMVSQLLTSQQVDQSLSCLKQHWAKLFGRFRLEEGDDKLMRMVNTWQPYQVMVTFNLSRSVSLFESGIDRGIGFRDSAQDIMGFVHLLPKQARQRLLDISSTQFDDGRCYHQYQPLTKKGNNEIGDGFNDDPLWLIMATSDYIKETGDWSILNELAPYGCNPDHCGSMMEHLKNSFHHVMNNLGPHGLPLIGRADWNDCLNLNCFSKEPDESFQTCSNSDGRVAESVLIAGMFCYCGKDYVRICEEYGDAEEASLARQAIADMEDAIMKHGFDGQWFLRAYDYNGNKIGASSCKEGSIYIEPQGFCAMAKIGLGKGYVTKALDSAQKYLDTDHGMILVDPPYSSYRLELGEISSYSEGHKENGGIFCHTNPWVAIGETVIGRGSRAFEIYRKITPSFNEENAEIYRMEPYCYAQMIAGKHAVNHGQAKNSWLTGTASWMLVLITQYILGVRPTFDGLQIDPCIPSKWKTLKIRRKFRNATYNITINNPDNVEKDVAQIIVDGKEISGNLIEPFPDGTHNVFVTMRSKEP